MAKFGDQIKSILFREYSFHNAWYTVISIYMHEHISCCTGKTMGLCVLFISWFYGYKGQASGHKCWWWWNSNKAPVSLSSYFMNLPTPNNELKYSLQANNFVTTSNHSGKATVSWFVGLRIGRPYYHPVCKIKIIQICNLLFSPQTYFFLRLRKKLKLS